jgi:hypothetical protein
MDSEMNGGEAPLAQLLLQSERAQLAEFNCEQLRQHLAEQATRIAEQAKRIAELEVSSAPRLENVQTELEAARIRIKDLESEVRSKRDEMRSRAREGHEETKRMLELREQTYREQYDCCKRRISALEQERDKIENELDEALRAFIEVEEISSSRRVSDAEDMMKTQWIWLQRAVLAIMSFLMLLFLWGSHPTSASHRLALIL